MMHIAGIGASAGGLEAMLPMCARLRPTGRIAYVIAQHMANDGHSELVARLIQRESALPVILVDKTVRLQADTVYMIPAGKDGLVSADTLTLSEPAAGNISTPSVNTLFRSIAESCGSNAIGIVLSGTGSDGVAGCRAIRAAGGLTLAQEPTEAKYAGMPAAVIDAGLADQVVPVERWVNGWPHGFPVTLLQRWPSAPKPLPQQWSPAKPLSALPSAANWNSCSARCWKPPGSIFPATRKRPCCGGWKSAKKQWGWQRPMPTRP